ncbi:MAG: hypothetical protein OEZ68_04150 [Gammaproteobacteria bacterium]|nr:hypothetical protein [Gammaproteobacteria bacterium]MDH5799979.1 hypothetical protein [Gammaproteobacteria bacterium]
MSAMFARQPILLWSFSLLLLLSACGDKQDTSKDMAQAGSEPTTAEPQAAAASQPTPQALSFTRQALYPEGVEYDAANKRFLVTSLREGIVGTVAMDGTYTEFAKDPNFVSAIGIRVDATRDRFMVCNSDPGAGVQTKEATKGKLAGLGVFRLSTGKLMKYIDLGKQAEGGHFCNDIAVDANGNVYVTDSFSPIIYKVDAGLNESILLNHERFKGEGFNLNGIVHKDGYLLVTKYNEGLLFKVPLNEPDKFTQVSLKETFPGADGLAWAADGSLMLIANLQTNKVVKLSSADNWVSAEVVKSTDTGPVFATTGVVNDAGFQVLHARLNVLFDPKTTQHVDSFQIVNYGM